MTFRPVQHRYCSRCRCELSDVASMERGMGPLCAGKSTKLYAKTIPANYALANISALSIRDEFIHPECHALWNDTKQKLLEATQSAANVDQNDRFAWTGEDLRKIVKSIDFILSYRHPRDTVREQLIQVVMHLGYVGLAGVLSGEASTGEARLWFEDGLVKLQGSRNKSAYRAFAMLRGVKLPRAVGQPYVAPISLLEPFLSLVLQYYPMYEGDFDTIRSAAAAWIPPVAPVVVPVQSNTSVAELMDGVALIRIRSEDFTLQFNWMRHMDMNSFIANLKNSVAYNERAFDMVTKLWRFKKAHLDTIKNVIANCGLFTETIVNSTEEITPANSYSFNSSFSSTRPRNRYNRSYI